MTHGFHPPSEEYLEAVLELEEDGVEVIQARLTERLGHSAPTVSETVRRLRDEGFVNVDGRRVGLTTKGRARAEGVLRKHRLAECLLVDVIGLPWQKCHDEATRWEHVISDEVESKLIELLNHPVACPHGNPIPGAEGSNAGPVLVRLADVPAGTTVVLERVSEQAQFDQPSLDFLARNDLLPGAEFVIAETQNDGSVQVSKGKGSISKGEASNAKGEASIAVDGVLAARLYVSLTNRS